MYKEPQTFDPNSPDQPIIDEDNTFTMMVKIGGALVACFVGGLFFGLMLVNLFMVPGLHC